MQLLAFMHSRTLPTSFATVFVDCHFKELKFIGVKRAAAESLTQHCVQSVVAALAGKVRM